ncbi:MAG: L-aspartate oxidase [Phycisphaeraceae bacterium]
MHSFDERRYLIPFRATLLPQIFTDVLVIGTGVAGMRAALAAAGDVAAGEGPDVIVAGKGELKHSSTYWAQGGIAAVLAADDSVDEHVRDTLVAGAGLCDEPVVRQVVEAGPGCIHELIEWGMPFDRPAPAAGEAGETGERLAFGREGGHSRFRVLHSDGDATGKALAHTLAAQVTAHPRVRHFDQCFVLDLITSDTPDPRNAPDAAGTPGHCLGAITHHPRYGLQVIWAQATILASGGCGQVFRESTNPSAVTGDGLAMAARAGAELMDLAFMQFHPTTLYIAGASRSLITEAVRGEGAYLIDRHGHRFMFDYDERGELAPRDVVSRAILQQMGKTGHTHVYLDVRHLGRERFNQRFPGIAKLLAKFDIDPGASPVPVHPSAHYMIGGVRTDHLGRTSIPGLYAAGEVACTGLHGANRLASNSLLEGHVFGALAGEHARKSLTPNGRTPHKIVADIRPSDRSELDLADVRSSLRSVMWRHVGIEREGNRLAEVSEMFEFWGRYTMDKIFDDQAGWEVQNLLTVGALITRAARWRAESRGTHFRVDHPEPDEAFRVHDIWRHGSDEPTTRPVVEAADASVGDH